MDKVGVSVYFTWSALIGQINQTVKFIKFSEL